MTNHSLRAFFLALGLLLIVGLGLALAAGPGQAAPGAGPALAVPATVSAAPNSIVSLPVSFAANGNSISAVVFSIDYDETNLSYDAAYPPVFSLPPGFSGSCIPDTADTDGELDCFIFFAGFPLQPLPDGTLATVKLKVGNPGFAAVAPVNFSTSSPAFSFGNTQGFSVPGTASNGVVQISGTQPPAQADLQLVKVDNPDPVFASTPLTYTLTITNNGPDNSGTVVLTDTLPAGTSFQQAIGSGWICSLAANKLTCSRPGMAMGANASLVLVVKAPATSGAITNKAGVRGSVNDPVLGNNNASATTTVAPWADLAVSNSCMFNPGNALVLDCTVTARNEGPAAADSVSLGVTWNAPISSYQNINASGWSCGTSGSTLTCTRASLPVSGSASLTFQVVTPSTAGLCSTATVAAATADLVSSNNAASSCPSRIFLPLVAKDAFGAQPSISGVVLSNLGQPLAGVTVSDSAGHTAVTDSNGAYTLSGMPPGTYTISASNKVCYGFNSVTVTLAGTPLTNVNLTGTPNCSISGVVTRDGSPLSGVTVSDNFGHTSVTNASGAYTLSGLTAGSYTVTPSKACYTFVPLSRFVTVSGQHTAQNFSAVASCYITGKVTKGDGTPLAGVTLNAGAGKTALSDGNGNYTISGLADGAYTVKPSLTGFTFSPVSRFVVLPPNQAGVNFTTVVAAGCTGAINNGGFEYTGEWVFPVTVWSAGYSQSGDPTKAGERSLRTGILSAANNIYTYSSAYQEVSIPSDATAVNLAYWMYPRTTEAPLSPLRAMLLNPDPFAPDAVDSQYALVKTQNGNNYFLMNLRSNIQDWAQYKFDLLQKVGSFIKGQKIQIWFGSFNDGADGVTAMFVDEVTLEVCRP